MRDSFIVFLMLASTAAAAGATVLVRLACRGTATLYSLIGAIALLVMADEFIEAAGHAVGVDL